MSERKHERERWERLADALATQDELSDDERRFVDELDDPVVSQERALYAALAQAGQPQPASTSDLQRAAATLAAFRRAQAVADEPTPAPRRGWAVSLGVAAVAIAAAVLLWISWPAPDSLGMHHSTDGGFALELSDSQRDSGDIARTRPSKRASLTPDATDATVAAPPEAPANDGGEPLETDTLDETDEPLEADAADLPARRPSRARPATSSPSELLAAARGQVAAGEVERALKTYASLRRQHPATPEARAANVSVGELELRRGHAQAALDAFSRYLRGGGGALAEEAHWGKIRALHRLHREAERDAAIDALRGAHPTSVYLGRASSL